MIHGEPLVLDHPLPIPIKTVTAELLLYDNGMYSASVGEQGAEYWSGISLCTRGEALGFITDQLARHEP